MSREPPAAPFFTFGQRTGMLLISMAGCLSALAIIWLATRIAVDVAKRHRHQRGTLTAPHPIFLYFISLLLSSLIQTLSPISYVKWVKIGGVEKGPYCTAQAAFTVIGHPAVALANIAISFETFWIIVLRRRSSYLRAIFIIALIWLYVIIFVAVGLSQTYPEREGRIPFFGSTGLWCSTTNISGYFAKYATYWAAAIMSLLAYGCVAWTLYRIPNHTKMDGEGPKVARMMLYYPLVYTLSILPNSVARFNELRTGKKTPFAAVAVSGVFMSLAGFFDVLLWVWTRPQLFGDGRGANESEASTDEKSHSVDAIMGC